MGELYTVLAVDDSSLNHKIIEKAVSGHYQFRGVFSGQECLDFVAKTTPDLILLDVTMSGMDGYETCTELRKLPLLLNVPVLFLSGRCSVEEKLKGYEVGGDDYITKPFSTQELVARIRAVLRRRSPEQTMERVQVGDLVLDGSTHRVSFHDQALKLGPTEFKLLSFLMHHAERVHSRGQLLDKVWGDHVFIEERTVDVHIKRLREALGQAGVMVETVRGAGYRLTVATSSGVATPSTPTH